jgi:hypothetical protein
MFSCYQRRDDLTLGGDHGGGLNALIRDTPSREQEKNQDMPRLRRKNQESATSRNQPELLVHSCEFFEARREDGDVDDDCATADNQGKPETEVRKE